MGTGLKADLVGNANEAQKPIHFTGIQEKATEKGKVVREICLNSFLAEKGKKTKNKNKQKTNPQQYEKSSILHFATGTLACIYMSMAYVM